MGLLSDELLKEINTLIVSFGHDVFKKKEKASLSLKTHSYVVESNVHFPTDYNLLWDSLRKCTNLVDKITTNNSTYGGTSSGHSSIPTRMVKACALINGSYASMFRFGINNSGNFDIGGINVYSKAAVLSVARNNTSNIKTIFGVEFTTLTAIDKLYVGGKTSTSAANVNSGFFADEINDPFILKMNTKGEYMGALTSTYLPHNTSGSASN